MASSSNQAGGIQLRDHFKNMKANFAKRKLDIYKERVGKNLPNTDIRFVVLGTGSYGTAKSILMRTTHTSYLFNCGDGTFRQAVDYGEKQWTKLQHIFITHKSWERMGGLLEMSACLHSTVGNESPPLNIHGVGYVDCFADEKKRGFNAQFNTIIKRFPVGERLSDALMSIDSIRISNSTNPGDDEVAACAFKLHMRPKTRRCENKKLVKLCLKSGPWIAELIETNQPVTVEGRIVHPDDILSPAMEPESVLVIDCPSQEHLSDMCSKSEQLLYKTSDKFVDLVIHLTPDHVYSEPEYQAWMLKFPPTTHHMVVSESLNCISLQHPWDQQVHLNLLNKEIFPFTDPPPDKEIPPRKEERDNVHFAAARSMYTLRPIENKGFCLGDSLDTSIHHAYEYFGDNKDDVMDAVAKQRSPLPLDDNREYPVVSFLGTSASVSTKVRNVAGILLQTSESNYVLLDCGSGIYGQIVRLHGAKHDHILKNLSTIFISHGHPDHHLGLLSILLARKKAFEGGQLPKLVLLAPRKMGVWFTHLNTLFPGCMENVWFLSNYHLMSQKNVLANQKALEQSVLAKVLPKSVLPDEQNKILSDIGLSRLETVMVEHAYSMSCFGIVIGTKEWSVAYSGDTVPCEEFINAAKGVDLLIHECTFSDAFEDDAKLKTHCTTSQALSVVEACKPKYGILTHFSARYPRMITATKQLIEADNIGLAYDNLVMRFKDIPFITMANLLPVLSVMYPEYVAKQKHRYEKRMIKALKDKGVPDKDIVKQLNQITESVLEAVSPKPDRDSVEEDEPPAKKHSGAVS